MSVIEIKNLTKEFQVNGLTITALNHVSLSIDKGDVFGIIGMSGAGKSAVGKALRRITGRKLVDTDALIAADQAARETVRAIHSRRA